MFSRFLLVAALALTLTACDSGGADTVTATGTITNAFGLPVSGATVDFGTASGKRAVSVTTAQDGTYTIDVEPGPYTVTVSKSGYTVSSTPATVSDGTDVSPVIEGTASVSGVLVNALTGNELPGATIEFVVQADAGSDPTAAPVEVQALSDADGAFAFDRAPFGTYVCIVRADGLAPILVRDVVFEATGETELGQSVVTPLPAAGEYRVVLTWGEAPSDLDSHLTGPTADGDGRFHVYYSDESYLDTNLDVDDTSSFGPETITIVPPAEGVYRYSVHNYSDRTSADGALGIAASPARVQVFDASGLVRSYTAPPASSGEGNTWRVFEMTIAGGSVSFTGGMPGGIGYVFAESQHDGGEFFRDLPVKALAD